MCIRDSPLVSPAFGDFTGCPPVLIQCGSDEILYSDCLNLYQRMREPVSYTHLVCKKVLSIYLMIKLR